MGGGHENVGQITQLVILARQEAEVRGVTLISCLPAVLHSMVTPLTVRPRPRTENPSLDARTIESFSGLRRAALTSRTESRHCVVSKIVSVSRFLLLFFFL